MAANGQYHPPLSRIYQHAAACCSKLPGTLEIPEKDVTFSLKNRSVMAITSEQFQYNSENEDFETTFTFGDTAIGLSVCDLPENEKSTAFSLAQRSEAWLVSNIEKLKDYAAAELLELKNEEWMDEDEKPLTESEFKAGLTVSEILVFADGSFQLFLDDNDMFWGHHIILDVDANGALTGSGIAG